MPTPNDRAFADLTPQQVYGILRLRAEVFVVEQTAAYLDPDGRDLEPTARQLWFEDADNAVLATARALDDGDARRIGRIATRADHRGNGLAGELVKHFLATTAPPWRLDAQSHLTAWYASFGFEVAGAEYDDDGIPTSRCCAEAEAASRGPATYAAWNSARQGKRFQPLPSTCSASSTPG